MARFIEKRRLDALLWCGLCGCLLSTAGCLEQSTETDLSVPANSSAGHSVSGDNEARLPPIDGFGVEDRLESETKIESIAAVPPDAADVAASNTTQPVDTDSREQDRKFVAEGPQGALRIEFDDLDLTKLIQMKPITADCINRMPAWLRNLNDKTIRIGGYMRPSVVATGISQFLLVRELNLMSFGPAPKIDRMIYVTLEPGTTTDYIELKSFDVVGTFRIEILTIDDGLLYGLYHLDDAAIVHK
ncbi:MAG: hypothetical protein EXS05_15525 [Planctomycetaceae bacterium]|nr:hypothetical protein [Planctomycetaceae bacterium]